MIAVDQLGKRYGRIAALDGLSFEIKKGGVAALVGGNGAGKSTVLRILSTLTAPTDGDAVVCGYDVVQDALDVRRRIGYLAENTPLYGDQRVVDFLRFRAALKGVAKGERRERVQEVIRQCSLQGVERRRIATLSRGFQKRVGLADALVHLPEVLLLDEPMVGLDAVQVPAVRELIGSLAGRHTVLFTTHSREEAEAVCRQVLHLQRGRLVTAAPPVPRTPASGGIYLEIRGDHEAICQGINALAGVRRVETAGEGDGRWHRLVIRTDVGRDVRPDLFALAANHQWVIREIRLEEGDPCADS
jgi:ABC-2 type transport system ATP-binding protein